MAAAERAAPTWDGLAIPPQPTWEYGEKVRQGTAWLPMDLRISDT